ncbi:unnamed protein product [Moneuplotes crassus]|uniref:histidine kinase n=1 Tax=Euplotes crassus TaxID=5936 RepID=A0AAD2D574_EUPCR|nr:unnamed protein product [Moneuplotes crassus]
MNLIQQFFIASQQKDAEFATLQSKIPKSEVEHLNRLSIEYIKKSQKVLAFTLMCFISLSTLNKGMSYKQIVMACGSSLLILGFFLISHFIQKFPKYLQILILSYNALGYIGPHLSFWCEYKGHANTFIPAIYLHHFYLATLTPSKRHLTSLIFALTVALQIVLAIYRFGEIDSDIIASGLMCILISDLSLRMNQTRLSQMYRMILENRKLVKEKQKVVQEFPHPVLILPQKMSKLSKCYPNDQFEQRIKTLNHKIQALDKVQVELLQKDEKEKIDHKLSLLEYLSQIKKHQDYDQETKGSTVIHCKNMNNKENIKENAKNITKRNFHIKSLHIEWKEVPSVMHVFIDTTDIIKLEQAKSKIRVQKIMFASISHEFMTPLNAIIHSYKFIETGFKDILQMLQQKVPQDLINSKSFQDQVEFILKFIKTGSTSSVLLLSLVEDILSLSKIDIGTLSASFNLFYVPELLQDVHSLFSVQCQNKRIDLAIDCEDDLQICKISSDCNRIKQILVNLVSNSVKFTFRGSITMKAALKKTLEGDDIVEFRVCDTGTGIKEEDQEHLFQMFEIIGQDEDLSPDGCGLGLTISKKYVELLGGEICIESVYGKGTIAIFTIMIHEITKCPSKRPRFLSELKDSPENSFGSMSGLDFKVNEEYDSKICTTHRLPASNIHLSKFSYN